LLMKLSSFIRDVLNCIGEMADKYRVPVYAVGGFVRDSLLGKEANEIDFVAEGDGPEFAGKVQKKLKGRGLVIFERFGTASFYVKDLKLEFVTARKESYKPHSRKPVVQKSDLAGDLSRRDFTINTLAMALNQENFGSIIDFHHGRSDLKKKLIRTPLEPGTTFSDDPLRVMRAARFASQLSFRIDASTLAAMKEQRERLKIVSQERIRDEFFKILSHPKPSTGIRILLETGVLEIVFPELAVLAGIEQRDLYHHKDVFDHTMKVVDNLAGVTDNLKLRFAGLVHDIGKPRVKQFVEGTGWTFHGHEQAGVHMLKKVCRRMKLSNDYYDFSSKMTYLHMRPIQLISEEVTDSAIRRLIVQAGEQLENLIMLCRADITSGNPKRVKSHLENFDFVMKRIREVEEKDRMRSFQSPVRGDEIMKLCGLEPGPLVGRMKRMIEEAILDGKIPNEHDPALHYLLQIKDKILAE
jgi:poly(A) polymerase